MELLAVTVLVGLLITAVVVFWTAGASYQPRHGIAPAGGVPWQARPRPPLFTSPLFYMWGMAFVGYFVLIAQKKMRQIIAELTNSYTSDPATEAAVAVISARFDSGFSVTALVTLLLLPVVMTLVVRRLQRPSSALLALRAAQQDIVRHEPFAPDAWAEVHPRDRARLQALYDDGGDLALAQKLSGQAGLSAERIAEVLDSCWRQAEASWQARLRWWSLLVQVGSPFVLGGIVLWMIWPLWMMLIDMLQVLTHELIGV